jgi:hypothetical protein
VTAPLAIAMRLVVTSLVLGSIASAVSFGVAAQTRNAAEVVRASATGTIAGHVTDAHSKPIEDYSVIVFSTDRRTWSPDSRSVMTARPAKDGGFEVVGLAPGEYWVAAVDAIPANQPPSEWGKPEALERLSTRATRVMLGPQERSLIVLRILR